MAKPRNSTRAEGGDRGRRPRRDVASESDWRWADPKDLKVNPAFQGLVPLQSRGEYLALEQSIRDEGCRDPLTVWKGHNVVLDGHTRRELCIGNQRRVKVREVELADEREAVEYILRIQRQRRNLTREAMSYFRGAEYNAVKQQRGGRRRGRKPKGPTDYQPSTAVRLAEKYGVSEKTVKRDAAFALAVDKIVAEYGDPEVRRRLLGADVRLTHAVARALLRTPAEDRKAEVDRLIEYGESPRAGKVGPAPALRPKDLAQSIVARLQKKGEGHARSVLQQMARLLGMEVTEKASDK